MLKMLMEAASATAVKHTGGRRARAAGAPVQRVRKAYEQVYDQIRALIVGGQMKPGERLPGETALARDFGVSRGTVREALRALAAHDLIRTAKGARGGSFVTLPTADRVSELLRANIHLLAETHGVSAAEMLEARELLECFAARMAAARRTAADVDRLRACIPEDPLALSPEELYAVNAAFHRGLLQAASNQLVAIAAAPVFQTLQTRVRRNEMRPRTRQRINDEHRAILAAVERGDADAAEQRMRAHLAMLRDTYERLWTSDRRHRRAGPPSHD